MNEELRRTTLYWASALISVILVLVAIWATYTAFTTGIWQWLMVPVAVWLFFKWNPT